MYIVTAPWLLRKWFPAHLMWSMPNKNNEIYLTFDDGPHPVATPFVLDLLDQYQAKATFFCIGKNVRAYPELYAQILSRGHRVGNHTNDHLNGKKTADKAYFDNIASAAEVIDSKLFRPPYGAITSFQANQLKGLFSVVMWNVLSADFDTTITPQRCLQHVVKHTRPGSIIVFHDSEKAFTNLQYALPKALEHFAQQKFQMAGLP